MHTEEDMKAVFLLCVDQMLAELATVWFDYFFPIYITNAPLLSTNVGKLAAITIYSLTSELQMEKCFNLEKVIYT